MTAENWSDPFARCLGGCSTPARLRGSADRAASRSRTPISCCCFNAHHESIEFRLPDEHGSGARSIDTRRDFDTRNASDEQSERYVIGGRSLALLISEQRMKRRHAMPFGAELAERGVRFALWAPARADARLHLDGHDLPMERGADGCFVRVEESRARARATRIVRRRDLPCPIRRRASTRRTCTAPSAVVDPRAFDWTDERWRGRPWRRGGDLRAARRHVHARRHVRRGVERGSTTSCELGVTAIELMPLADFPGTRNWGYDGVLPFAPEHGYGTPEDLKRFVEAAHARGLMVLLDVVYNHFGPEGNYLHALRAAVLHRSPPHAVGRGDQLRRRRAARSCAILHPQRALLARGIPLRRPAARRGARDRRRLAARLSRRARATPFATTSGARHVHLVLENDANAGALLARAARRASRGLTTRSGTTTSIMRCTCCSRGERDGYYADYAGQRAALIAHAARGLRLPGRALARTASAPRGEPSAHLPPDAFVNFLQNHDQVGNRAYRRAALDADSAPERCSRPSCCSRCCRRRSAVHGRGVPRAEPVPVLLRLQRRARRRGGGRAPARDSALVRRRVPAPLPSPIAAETRHAAVLDWAAPQREPHATALARMRAWLGLRRSVLFPRLPARAERGALLGERALESELASRRRRAAARRRQSGRRRARAHRKRRASRSRARLRRAPDATLPPWHVCWTLEHG